MNNAVLSVLAGCVAAIVPALSSAQTPAQSPTQRARGPALALAVEAAQTAIATCRSGGFRTTALVVDSAGLPVALLSDGANPRTIDIAGVKVAATLKYRAPSGEIAERAKTDAALAAEIKADPKIGVVYGGALPLMASGELVGAFAVSGAPSWAKDEVCTKAGIDQIAGRLQ